MESSPKLTRTSGRKADLQMKVNTSDFGSRNMLRAMGVFKVGWGELGWGWLEHLQKWSKQVRDRIEYRENMNVHVHKNRATS